MVVIKRIDNIIVTGSSRIDNIIVIVGAGLTDCRYAISTVGRAGPRSRYGDIEQSVVWLC